MNRGCHWKVQMSTYNESILGKTLSHLQVRQQQWYNAALSLLLKRNVLQNGTQAREPLLLVICYFQGIEEFILGCGVTTHHTQMYRVTALTKPSLWQSSSGQCRKKCNNFLFKLGKWWNDDSTKTRCCWIILTHSDIKDKLWYIF